MLPESRPPLVGRWLLALRRLGPRQEEVESDLLDSFRLRAARYGRRVAQWRYLADVLSLYRWRPEAERDARSPRASHTAGILNDIAFAFRVFRRTPGLFGLTVLGLAVAIGISTAVVSVVKAVAFANYGVEARESARRVSWLAGVRGITGSSPFQGQWAFDEYSRIRPLTSTITLVGSVTGSAAVRLAGSDGLAAPVRYLAVGGDYFSALGLRAVLGRPLSSADDTTGSTAAVVSHGFWRNALRADPAIVGRTIWLGARPFTVVGVADRLHSAPPIFGEPPALWIAMAAERDVWLAASGNEKKDLRARLATLEQDASLDLSARDRYAAIEKDLGASERAWNPAVEVLGRVRPGATVTQAEAELNALSNVASQTNPRQPGRPAVRLDAVDGADGNLKAVAAVLVLTVGLVLLIACANVTNILLANAASRRREIGTRLAIGASRGRVLRQLLTESCVIAGIASAIGLWIGFAVIPTFAAMIHIPVAIDVSPDARVYMSLALMTCGVGIFAGLAPARYAQGQDLTVVLKTDQVTAPLPLPRARLRSALIATQAAVSALLLVLAALLTRSLIRASTTDVGYDLNRLMTVSIGNPTSGGEWTATRQTQYWDGLLEEVRLIPGVASAAFAVAPPFGRAFFPAQRIGGRLVNRNEVSPEYFSTIGLPILEGRTFSSREVASEEPVAIVSASLARAVWGAGTALDKDVSDLWGTSGPDERNVPPIYRKPIRARVVGVVPDITTRVGEPPGPTIYLPLGRTNVAELTIRTQGEPGALFPPVRDRMRSFDPRLQPVPIFPREQRERQMEAPRLLATLSVTVGAVALGLALIGLFGVTAFVVQQRTHELSVRRALGATSADLVTMLYRESLGPVMIGLACGVFLSLASGRVLQSLLYGVSARDPLALIAAITMLLAAATIAVFFPVRRAASLNLAQLLKLG